MNSGFTLTEIIIAVFILLIVILAVFGVFFSGEKFYHRGEVKVELLQNGRVVIDRMAREVRQAEEIVTPLSENRSNATSSIEFEDGHLPSISETGTVQDGSTSTITLDSDAKEVEDYYENMFIKITDGTGLGQIREIISYSSSSKQATVDGSWDTVPDSTSDYRVGSEHYYIKYSFSTSMGEVFRQYRVYCFNECGSCDDYYRWDDTTEKDGEIVQPHACNLKNELVGEYMGKMEFWGSNLVNIYLLLEKGNLEVPLKTKILGRNI